MAVKLTEFLEQLMIHAFLIKLALFEKIGSIGKPDHVNYSPPPVAIGEGEIVSKVWMKFIEITSTNRNAN